MPRLGKDSDEEVDTKHGRKTRALTEVLSVNSPLRRSSRIKVNVKQNESSPESPLSDASNISNTQTSRVRTRRKIAMDSSTVNENSRALRSRIDSVSSDVSEVTETDIGTPTKKTKSNDVGKTNSRRSKRFTRAGSEANSPPPAIRITRSTRASSMGPEGDTTDKITEKHQNELTNASTKMKRRASILPSEATVIEEKECMKIPMVTLDRTLPEFIENKKSGSKNSPKTTQNNESLSASKNKLKTDCNSINEKDSEDDAFVKGLHNNSPENTPSNSFKAVEKDTPTDGKKMADNDKNALENSETLFVNTTEQIKSSINNESQIISQDEDQNMTEELKIKLEDSMEKHEDHSDKENITTNINDSQSAENIISNSLQSPKSVSIDSLNTNKLTEEKCKSPYIETTETPKRRHSKQSLDMSNDNDFVKEVNNDIDAVNNLSLKSLNTSVNKEDNSDNMRKLIMINAETDSISDSLISESSDKNNPIHVVTTPSSLDGSIEIIEDTEGANIVDDNESTEMNTELNEESGKIYDEKCNEDVKIETDISNAKESIDENEESVKDNLSQNIITSDKCDKKSIDNEPNTLTNIHENDKMNCTKLPLSPTLSNIELPQSMDVKLIPDTQHSIISEHKNIHCLQSIDETNNLPSNTSIISNSLDADMSQKNSALINTNDSNVTDVIKDIHSSIVTETPAEFVEESSEKGDQSKKVSTLDESLTSKKESTQKSVSNKKRLNITEVTSKESQENMEVDDDDETDANTANLFKDIPATEWKEKNGETDKNSVYSMSTEKLENESEGECDLVLVDKEAWLAAENLKADKEKETFDYDSDDTVLLKIQKDLTKPKNDEKVLTDVPEEKCELNVSKNKSASKDKQKIPKETENKRKENVTKDTEDILQDTVQEIESTAQYTEQDKENTAQDAKDISQNMSTNVDHNKSVIKVSKKHSLSKCSESIRKSLENESLSESSKTVEIEENVSLNKSKLSEDIPKKRKSLQGSKKLEEFNETETVKNRKSLNKSNCKEIDMNEIELSNENSIVTSAKKDGKNQSLNNSLKKKLKSQQLNKNVAEESDDEFNESEIRRKQGSATNKQLNRYSTAANIGSDSDENKDISDSDESQNNSMKLPKFLFGGLSDSEDNESNKTMDSDIRKEYNLDGNDISKFSDDDVPGDECRASETESSDPDDNGSDLADFVVDDDEKEEEEEENDSEENDSEEVEEKNDTEEEEEEETENDLDKEENVQTDDEEEKQELDEEMQESEEEIQKSEEEMQVEKKIEQKTIHEEQHEDDKENIDEKDTNKLISTSKKEKNKSRKSNDSNLSEIIGSGKKSKKDKTDKSQTEKGKKQNSFTNLSFSTSFEIKKTKQKRASGEFIVENIEGSLNDSQSKLNKKLQKLNKSMECSTPKINSSKREKFDFETYNVKENDFYVEEKNKNITLNKENNLKKLSNIKSNETLMHRSLPSELIELATKTNLSRPMSSNVTELNKTTLVPGSETPATKFLKKEKLNESAPVLKLDTKFKKSSANNSNEQNKQVEEDVNENENVEVQDKNDSAKTKLLKVADTILETDRQKKRKKRKQPTMVETTKPVLFDNDFRDNQSSEIIKKAKHIVPITITDNNDETEKVDQKKKKKKKKKTSTADVQIQEEVDEEFIEVKSETHDEKTCNKGKKKKKKGKTVEDISDVVNTSENTKIVKKKKKVSNALSSEITEKQLLKKKQKKQKLLLNDAASQNEDESLEKLPKKKKKLSENALQHDEASAGNIPKKKQKLSKDTLNQNEDNLFEKLSKKKQKLLEGAKTGNVKHTMASYKSQFTDTISDSDEGPETVAFSKARDEALEVLKRTADSIKANKEMKKKKQRERMEKIGKQKETKIKHSESKNLIESNKMEVRQKNIIRLPDDVLENLSDVPLKSQKRKKVSMEEEVPEIRKIKKPKNIYVEDDNFTLPSCAGSTTEFSVVDIQTIRKKKKSNATSFRKQMLNRNSRQPVSAYLMYLEKQKASGNTKFCNKPYYNL